jgi:hypothetical protein
MKKYKFAWHENQEDAKSDVTVSSVHTSDLSISEDFTSESELEYSDLTDHGEDMEEEVISLDQTGEKKQEVEVTEEQEKSETKGERLEKTDDQMEEGKAVEAGAC